MGSWRDVAAALLDGQAAVASPDQTTSPVGCHTGSGLSPDVFAGLTELQTTPPPRFVGNPDAWHRVVEDAHRLAADGWAAKALRLGWSVHDVFGIGAEDSNDFAGLAVWLGERVIVMLDEQRAMVRIPGGHACFERGGWGHGRDDAMDPVLLWQFGRR